MEGVKEISPCFFDQTMSGLFGVYVTIGLMNYSVLNIYCHLNFKVATISQEAAQFFSQNSTISSVTYREKHNTFSISPICFFLHIPVEITSKDIFSF